MRRLRTPAVYPGTQGRYPAAVSFDKTLVLAGTKPKRVRLRIVKKKTLEQTVFNKTPKVTTKTFKDEFTASREFEKAVRKKLRDDYVVLGEAKPGNIILEAFAPGGGGGPVLDMSMDGRFIVTASITSEQNFGAKLETVEVATGARHLVLEESGAQQNFLHAALFDRSGESLIVSLREETFRLDIASGKRTPIAKVKDRAFNPFVVQPCFDNERKRLVVFDEAKSPVVRVLDESGKKLLDVSMKSQTTECRGAGISPSGRLLALYVSSRGIIYGHDDAMTDTTNDVQIWDIEAGERWETVTVADKLHGVGLSYDDTTLLVTDEYYNGPTALEIPSGTVKWKLAKDGMRTEAWTYSPDGKRLAIAGNVFEILDAKTRKPAIELTEVYARRPSRPIFSRDGKRVALSADGTAIVFAL